ncbi:MAG: YbaK/EbsC family protein [Anaerolineae bacterium]|nr:YbaK/EbsC family protein [Anaerolineae bacterium]MBT7069288.1 YbaK/EbsC family protein [Anaerolineae bacterium]
METLPPVSLILTKLNASHRVFEHKTSIKSIEQAAAERGQVVSQVVRSILFRIGKDEFIMVLVAGPAQLSWSALRAHLGQSRMTMATKEEVLCVTGYPIGTVAPIGIASPIRLLADKNVFVHDEISFGSGKRNTAIMMKRKEFQKILGTVEIGTFSKEDS